MPIRELTPDETALAFEVMRELRTHLESVEDFVDQVNEHQRPDGYRLVALFDDGEVASVAGFRRGWSLAWGDHLYVDDLVTAEAFRGRGHASAVLEWIGAEARRLGSAQVHLDSGAHRHDAHRLYLSHGFRITGLHFATDIS